MISKKKIIAIVAFILMGFVMFTFANPSDGIDPLTEPIKDEEPQVEPVNNEEQNPTNEQPVVIIDNAPVITVVPATVKVVEGTEYDIMTGVTAVDDRDNNLNIRSSITPTEMTEVGNYEVTYTVVDSGNNTATAKRTIIILDADADEDNDGYTNIEEVNNDSDFDDEESMPEDEAPEVILTPEEITIEFGEELDLMEGLEIEDDFDSIDNEKLLIELDIEDTTTLTVGEHTVNYTITDRKGNVTKASRKIVVEDTTEPTIKLNGASKITLEAGVETYTELNATATDIVDGTWVVEPTTIKFTEKGKEAVEVDTVDTTKVGSYEITYSCEDKAGNKCLDEAKENEFVKRTVVVEDTTAPTLKLTGASEIILEAGVETYIELNATATDIVDGTWVVEPTTIKFTEKGKKAVEVDTVDTTKVGSYEITYSCEDKAGNKCLDEAKENEYVKRTVVVEDTTAPTLKLNGASEITLEAGVDTYTELNATATDIIDGTWTVERSFIHYSIDGKFQGKVSEIDNTKVGMYKVQYSCKDKAGNKCVDAKRADHDNVLRIVNVVDTTAPTLKLNGASEITLEAGVDTYTELNATATDIIDGTWTVERSFIHYSIDGKFQGKVNEIDNTKVGMYKVQYSCKDKAGNKCVDAKRADHDNVLRIVNVVDTTAPTIKLNGASSITLEAGVETYTELNATATDILDGSWTIEPSNINYSINGEFQGKVDHVDTTKVGTYKISYTCKDKAGNKCIDAKRADHDYVLRVVTVVDTKAPTIKLNGASSITLEAGVDTYTELNATATDILDGSWTIEPSNINYSINGKFQGKVDHVDTTKVGTYKISYTCKDKAGNKCIDAKRADHDYVLRVVTVVDTKAPTIKLNGASSITLEAGVDTYTELNAIATDILDGSWTIEPSNINYSINGKFQGKVDHVDTTKIGTYKISYTCKDKAGNECLDAARSDHNYIIRFVEVKDTTAPVITGIANGETYVNTATYEVADKYLSKIIVDGTEYSLETAPYTITSEGEHTVIAVDSSNNSMSVTFTIERRYNVTFVDYNGKELASGLIKSGTSAASIAPDMTGKTYTSKNVTYVFENWDKDFSKITEETTIKATYGITRIIADLFELDENVTRPENGGVATNWQKVYTKLGEVELKLIDEVVAATKKGSNKVLNYNVNEILNYVVDTTLLPAATADMKENFKKYEWYVVKMESSDGWHIDGQKVLDLSLLNAYRENAKNIIINYATELGFSEEITNLLVTANIDSLTTKSTIDQAVADAKASVDALLEEFKEVAKAIVIAENNGFIELYVAQANGIVDTANTNIENSATKNAVETARDNAIAELNNLKALMKQTFTVSLVNDKNNVLISEIASDVKIEEVVYVYSIYSKETYKQNHNGELSLIIKKPLDEGYRDANEVNIKYTKNGKSYLARYSVNYDGFIIKLPVSISLISNSYVA